MICDQPSKLQPPTNYKYTSFVDIEYRQLVSRSSTQRLHSPSLDPLGHVKTDNPRQWEIDDRKKSRAKAQQQLRMLGVSWSKAAIPSRIHENCTKQLLDRFVQDIQSAEREIYFLTSARYNPIENVNMRATTLNQQTQYRQSVLSHEWKEMHVAQMQALRMFGRARVST
jgi:hypothetical protein